MVNSVVTASMDIGSGREAVITLRSDVATYFGITAAPAGDTTVTRRRKAHTRAVYDGLSDTAAVNTNVAASTWQAVKRVSKIGSGKRVRIPTKLKTAKDNIRYVDIRVPGNANVASISKFLFTKIEAAKRPDFFIMESGARYPVVNVTGDVNPGEAPVEAVPET